MAKRDYYEILGVQNASSIAAMVLITEALVTDIPGKEKMPSMPVASWAALEITLV